MRWCPNQTQSDVQCVRGIWVVPEKKNTRPLPKTVRDQNTKIVDQQTILLGLFVELCGDFRLGRFRLRSDRMRRCSQLLRANNETNGCQLDCSHRIASNIKGLAHRTQFLWAYVMSWRDAISGSGPFSLEWVKKCHILKNKFRYLCPSNLIKQWLKCWKTSIFWKCRCSHHLTNLSCSKKIREMTYLILAKLR